MAGLRLPWILAYLLLGAGPAHSDIGRDHAVQLDLTAPSTLTLPDVELVAEPIGLTGNAPALPVRLVLTAPGQHILQLTREAHWRIRTTDPRVWAADVTVEPQTSPIPTSPVLLALQPAGRLSLTWKGGRAPFSPTAVEWRPVSQPKSPTARTSCSSNSQGLVCKLPAGNHDLRLQVKGYAPLYFWGVVIQAAKETNVGVHELRPGGSVTGKVIIAAPLQPSESPFGVKLTLQPFLAGLPQSRDQLDRMATRALHATADSHGFFQVAGVGPGQYTIRAAKGERASRPFRVTVSPDQESRLDEPLLLVAPAQLEVLAQPPVAPGGQPWQLELMRPDDRAEYDETVVAGKLAIDGTWSRRGLQPGDYRVRIRDLAGSKWQEEEIHVDGDTQVIFEMDLITVEGSLTLAGKGVDGVLWFGGRSAAQRIRVDTDSQGRFTGYLPHEGDWKLDLESHGTVVAHDPVEVKPLAKGSRVRIDVEFPNTLLAGQVVDEQGKPVDGAEVIVLLLDNARRRREAQVMTERDGLFRARGVTPGQLTVQARAGDRQSDFHTVQVYEDMEAPRMILVVAEMRDLRGVVYSRGAAVGGARVIALSGGGAGGIRTTTDAVTGADGAFHLRVPPQPVHLLVAAPGLPLTIVPERAANEIMMVLLDDDGGELVLDISDVAPGTAGLAQARLLADGASVSLADLARTPTAELVEATIRVPSIAAGRYGFCLTATQCVSGIVSPGASVTLDPTSERP